MPNAERLIQVLGQAFAGGEIEMSGPVIDAWIDALAPITGEDFVTVMTGPDDTFTATHEGADGLREAWADWLETFGTVRFELQGIEEVGENVLTLGRQTGISRHGVELVQPSAAVWKFRDGKLVQVEFHLDRDRAYESARVTA
jgi:ketosteroid isomerase-like protein